jgi:hypothetical protein
MALKDAKNAKKIVELTECFPFSVHMRVTSTVASSGPTSGARTENKCLTSLNTL